MDVERQLKGLLLWLLLSPVLRWHQYRNQVCPRSGGTSRGRYRLWHHQERQRHIHCQIHSSWSRQLHHHGPVCWPGDFESWVVWSLDGSRVCICRIECIPCVKMCAFEHGIAFNYCLGYSDDTHQDQGGSFSWCQQSQGRGTRTQPQW